MTITHSKGSSEFSDGWDRIFGGKTQKPKAAEKKTAKKAAVKATKKAAKKTAAKKKSAPKK